MFVSKEDDSGAKNMLTFRGRRHPAQMSLPCLSFLADTSLFLDRYRCADEPDDAAAVAAASALAATTFVTSISSGGDGALRH